MKDPIRPPKEDGKITLSPIKDMKKVKCWKISIKQERNECQKHKRKCRHYCINNNETKDGCPYCNYCKVMCRTFGATTTGGNHDGCPGCHNYGVYQSFKKDMKLEKEKLILEKVSTFRDPKRVTVGDKRQYIPMEWLLVMEERLFEKNGPRDHENVP